MGTSSSSSHAVPTDSVIPVWQTILQGNLDECIREDGSQFRKLLSTGIPQPFRWKVWMAALDLLNNAHYGSYMASSCIGSSLSSLCLALPRYADFQHCSSGFERQIEKDVGRTFAGSLNSSQQTGLYNVLNAYAAYNPHTGYCQGMNCVAGVLLTVSGSEEETFHGLIRLLNRHGLSGMYSEGLPLVRWLSRTCNECLNIAEPVLHRHFQEIDLLPEMYLPHMLMPLFAHSFPLAQVQLLWDVLICEMFRLGPAVLVYAVIATLKVHCERLLSMDLCEARDCCNMIADAHSTIVFLLDRLCRSTTDILTLGRLSGTSKSDASVRLIFSETWGADPGPAVSGKGTAFWGAWEF